MLAKDNEYLQEVAESLYVANADEIIREQCIAREDAERRERTLERDNRILKEENARLEEDKANFEQENARLRALLSKHGILEE